MTETVTLRLTVHDDGRHQGPRSSRTHVTIASSDHPDATTALGSEGLRDVLAKRLSQVERHGFDLAHDREHDAGELALGAASYLNTAIDQLHGTEHPADEPADTWPWEASAWKPGTARANLVKALALGLATVDRIDAETGAAGEDRLS